MRRFLPGSWHAVVVLTVAVLASSLAKAGDFDVSGRTEYRVTKSRLQAIQLPDCSGR